MVKDMSQTIDTRETIVKLLSNMADGKEIRSYLNRFSAVDQTRFAVIKIGGAILRDELEDTAAALAFLHTVGLRPVVIHGGGPQLDEALKAHNVDTPKVDGLRVTSPAAMDVARDVFIGENIKLVEAVRAQGVEAEGLVAGVIDADYLDREKFGLVGNPCHVRQGLLQSVVKSGAIPILTCMGLAPGGQLVNINGDSATRAVVKALQPMKVIFLTGVGGLLDHDGEIIHSINLAADYDGLMSADWVGGGMRLKLEEISLLLKHLPLSSSVSITRPKELIKELFTHGGSGTLIRAGEIIHCKMEKAHVDKERLCTLIENAFDRRLDKDWWAGCKLKEAHFSENYRTAAIVTDLDGVAYLDKFAVAEDARGEGISRTVWRRMAESNPRIYWRSRTDNGFNAFYQSMATGAIKRGEWTVFWTGDDDLATAAPIVAKIAKLKESFVPLGDTHFMAGGEKIQR